MHQRTRHLDTIWIPYAKVIKGQSFFGRYSNKIDSIDISIYCFWRSNRATIALLDKVQFEVYPLLSSKWPFGDVEDLFNPFMY